MVHHPKMDDLDRNRWLSESQRKKLRDAIAARKKRNMATLLPSYTVDDDGTIRRTPLFVLRTFPPDQPMHDEFGEIMTAAELIRRRTS